MKNKAILIFILILAMLCVPCLASLADNNSSESSSSASSAHNKESSSSSYESEEEESDSSSSEESGSSSSRKSSSSSSKSKSKSSSSSDEGHRFSGDPVQGKNPQFSELDLGNCDPDDGEDFILKIEDNDGYSEVRIQNTDIEGMEGDDNFLVKFEGCKLWIPIEIPAKYVEDDHINSKLIASYGAVSSDILDRVSSSIGTTHVLQTFSLTMTSYDVKGQPTTLNSFDGEIKFKYDVNAACINQYNRDKNLALVFYNEDTSSLEKLDYDIDTSNGIITVYSSNSGNFFLINSDNIDLNSSIKLNTKPPFLKVVLFIITFGAIGVSVGYIIYLVHDSKKKKSGKKAK